MRDLPQHQPQERCNEELLRQITVGLQDQEVAVNCSMRVATWPLVHRGALRHWRRARIGVRQQMARRVWPTQVTACSTWARRARRWHSGCWGAPCSRHAQVGLGARGAALACGAGPGGGGGGECRLRLCACPATSAPMACAPTRIIGASTRKLRSDAAPAFSPRPSCPFLCNNVLCLIQQQCTFQPPEALQPPVSFVSPRI